MDVLVTGASGFVGRRLVAALLDRGHGVTALVRDADRYAAPEAVRVVEGDLLEPGSFAAALDVDAAYYLVHSMRAGGDFEERDRRAARNFVAAASGGRIERVVYLGGLGEDGDDLSPHLRSRREVERMLGDGDYDLTTLRAAIIVGAGSAGFEMVHQLATRLPVMIAPRWVTTPCQPIAVADVVAYLAGVLDAPETAGGTYDIGGPEVLTYADMLRRVGRQAGADPRIVTVPVLTPRLSAYWIGLVSDVPASVARPLVDGLRNPVVVRDERIRDLVAVDPTSFDAAVARALDREPDAGPDSDRTAPTDAGA